MDRVIYKGKYPVLELDIAKTRTRARSVDEIIAALLQHIDGNPAIAYLGIFDHYAHTMSLGGAVADGVVDAKNLLFCFGKTIPDLSVLAVRPRSIGILDLGDHFHITFLEPPQDGVTRQLVSWCEALIED
ncbi:DUF6858 family protein [uncultured Cohaesibacter sp.]|uniref:DUF6858 family protein n=1 Tax=uncultured Cohaesibacter sp. TaxID=1002546 RepID=UPI0029C8A280|nr:hypothetical protein [uncultured Cohaesibacter sp.]